jgi:hypothetical protein
MGCSFSLPATARRLFVTSKDGVLELVFAKAAGSKAVDVKVTPE